MPCTFMTGCTATPVKDGGGEPETDPETDTETDPDMDPELDAEMGPCAARRLMVIIEIEWG